ncbi:hypothetical protein [Rickettsia hoogstraalii]|uniref:hypothetical protein n=1 Tax=Rickettsia hoogstraalii TaxID=467174 RepID=UPI0018CD501D|nr:hypothetical protein [Rickettsia hoogstraalii]
MTKQSSKKFCKSEFFYYFFWIAASPTAPRNDGMVSTQQCHTGMTSSLMTPMCI